ncbi:MAG: alpha/beta hydrolase [Archangium sp.]|nr:alpha/beta hydrolase [Archangium sp.]MDP3574300.1 alpha/beta hydrolase [Archangium sp.]
MSHSVVDANGLRFVYLAWGEGPLVLALHGFPDTPHTWDVIGPAIAAKGFRVVAPFLRGYAPSGALARDTTPRDLGEDTLALMTALGAQRAHLVGHDWGAEAVYAAVGLAPERVITLTAIGIPHRAAVRPTPKLGWALRHFATLRLPGAEQRFARDDFAELEVLIRRWSPTWKFTAAELAPIKACFRSAGTVHAALGYYRAASVFLPAFMKHRIAVPTLNFAGADDPGVSPSVYEATRTHYSGAFEVAVIPGGHFCHREAPEPLITKLLSHVERGGAA